MYDVFIVTTNKSLHQIGLLPDKAAVAAETVRQAPWIPFQLFHCLNLLPVDHHGSAQVFHELLLYSDIPRESVRFHRSDARERGGALT